MFLAATLASFAYVVQEPTLVTQLQVGGLA